jgi:hypothetical protein
LQSLTGFVPATLLLLRHRQHETGARAKRLGGVAGLDRDADHLGGRDVGQALDAHGAEHLELYLWEIVHQPPATTRVRQPPATELVRFRYDERIDGDARCEQS